MRGTLTSGNGARTVADRSLFTDNSSVAPEPGVSTARTRADSVVDGGTVPGVPSDETRGTRGTETAEDSRAGFVPASSARNRLAANIGKAKTKEQRDERGRSETELRLT